MSNFVDEYVKVSFLCVKQLGAYNWRTNDFLGRTILKQLVAIFFGSTRGSNLVCFFIYQKEREGAELHDSIACCFLGFWIVHICILS